MKNRKPLLGLALSALIASSVSWGGVGAPSEYPKAVKALVERSGFKVDRVEQTPIPGMTAYVLHKGLKKRVVVSYGDYLVFGRVINEHGEDLLGKFIKSLAGPVDVSGAVRSLKRFKVIDAGGLRPEILVLVDPLSSESASLVLQAKRVVEKTGAKVQFLVIPGVDRASFRAAAKILHAADPYSELVRIAKEYGGRADLFKKKEFATVKVTAQDAKYFDQLRDVVMHKLGIDVVPVSFYQHGDTGKWGAVFGDHPLEYVVKRASITTFEGVKE